MTTTGARRAAGDRDRIKEAERARDDLNDALRAAGVRLPSLRLDTASCVGIAPLVDLGRCNVETAHALTAALRPAPDAAR
ncbi:hypothetical protein ABZ695_30380 [Streptomyces sp. NPDC006976]|uniref:hypothetical protein n=1 Tax=unclassified Streptomyces TaxID=2593676 RepID=UPI0033EC0EF0